MKYYQVDMLPNITMNCSALDYYEYNLQGHIPIYKGKRSFFHVNADIGYLYFSCSEEVPLIVINPNGRVIYKKLYQHGNVKLKLLVAGTYLFKIWTENIDNFYTISFSGLGVLNAKQLTCSRVNSNKK